jgi:hypothetical protein
MIWHGWRGMQPWPTSERTDFYVLFSAMKKSLAE